MTRLDVRTQLARDLAHVNAQLGAINLDAPLAEFATPEQLVMWRAGIERARREITAAELRVHDLIFDVPVSWPVCEAA